MFTHSQHRGTTLGLVQDPNQTQVDSTLPCLRCASTVSARVILPPSVDSSSSKDLEEFNTNGNHLKPGGRQENQEDTINKMNSYAMI